MKKILIGMICDGKAGGIDKYLLNFYDSVKSEGLHIDFLTNKKDAGLEKALKESGSNLYEVASLIHPVRQYRDVKRLVQENGYDVLYMNISTALAFPALKAAHDCGVEKVVLHSHSSGYDCENAVKRWLFTCLHFLCKPLVSKYANRFYTCSDKAAEWMFVKRIIAPKRYQTIFNTVDTSKFCFDKDKRDLLRREMDVENKFVIGSVGNMCYQKNPLFLIDSFYQLQQTASDAVLVMIGDGPLFFDVKQRVEEYDIVEKVRFLGKVDASRGYMSAFDVFALPSNFEGLPIVSVEAQCCGLPCVLSDTISHEACISNMCRFAPITSARDFADVLLMFKDINREDFQLNGDLAMFSVEAQRPLLKTVID